MKQTRQFGYLAENRLVVWRRFVWLFGDSLMKNRTLFQRNLGLKERFSKNSFSNEVGYVCQSVFYSDTPVYPFWDFFCARIRLYLFLVNDDDRYKLKRYQ